MIQSNYFHFDVLVNTLDGESGVSQVVLTTKPMQLHKTVYRQQTLRHFLAETKRLKKASFLLFCFVILFY